jgi:hypothetical protein
MYTTWSQSVSRACVRVGTFPQQQREVAGCINIQGANGDFTTVSMPRPLRRRGEAKSCSRQIAVVSRAGEQTTAFEPRWSAKVRW